MDELRNRHASLVAEYDRLVKDTLANPDSVNANIVKITNLNTKISTVLGEMIRILTLSKSNNANLTLYRDELIRKLETINRDYDSLATDSDKLETLRRIRAFEDGSWQSQLKTYLIVFLVLVVVVVLLLLFKTYRKDTTAPTPSSAAAMPPLT